jgi:hypothetical protein
VKLFSYGKDGGPNSTVWGYWLIEWKSLFSIALLCFENGSREAYHSHAFNAISWLLKGRLFEMEVSDVDNFPYQAGTIYTPSLWPIVTPRKKFHKVRSTGRSWVLTFRGPWNDTWQEHIDGEEIILTHGRMHYKPKDWRTD